MVPGNGSTMYALVARKYIIENVASKCFCAKAVFSCLMETLLQFVFGNRSLYSLDILTEYSGFGFELNIKMYDFLA